MLQVPPTNAKEAKSRGNTKPSPVPSARLAAPGNVLGNQATLRLMRKCGCAGAPDCNCAMEDDTKKNKEKDSPTTALHRSATSSPSPEVIPSIVGETLRSPAGTLDPETRAFFESRFARDFGGVRLHTDARAAQSAQAVHALAYTVGRDIAFAPGQFAPSTPEGRRLLAHELAHVVQAPDTSGIPKRVSDPSEPLEQNAERIADQVMTTVKPPASPVQTSGSSGQAALARQTANAAPGVAGTSAPAATPEALILQWLNVHQFAPPAQQPEGAGAAAPKAGGTTPAATAAPAEAKPELHVLLNGEDMTISDAVQLAAADPGLKQPAEVIASVIKAQLAAPLALGPGGLTFVGPGNNVAGINLGGPRDGFGVNPAIAKTVDYSAIDDFLTAHGFDVPPVRDPTGSKASLDDKDTTVDDIAKLAFAALGQYPSLTKSEVLNYIRQKYVDKRGGPGTQIVFGYMLVAKFAQYVGGAADPNNPLRTQHQFSFTITRQHHANDSPGLESSFQGTVTLSDQGIANLQAGGQEAIVAPLLNGWIQVSGLLQVMASANWNKSVTGSTVITPALQVVGGGQVLVTPQIQSGPFKFLTGHVQLGVQAVAGTQITSAGPVGVANAGLVLNIPFSL